MKIVVALLCALTFLGSANAAAINADTCWTKVNSVAGYSQVECQDKGLTGFVPANDLIIPSAKTDLTSIKLYKNSLSGHIPTQLGVLTRLKVYTDYRNEVSGFLPSQIGVLTAMTEINIYKNKVSGTIPETAGGDPNNWPAAKINWNNFVIMNNKFSGCIPMELTVCSDDLPNNSVNGYCSMSTQGTPGIDGNCGTLAPTTAAPTTSAPTSCTPMPHSKFLWSLKTTPSCSARPLFFGKRVPWNKRMRKSMYFRKYISENVNPCGTHNPLLWTKFKCTTKKGKAGNVAIKRNQQRSSGIRAVCIPKRSKRKANFAETFCDMANSN